MIKFYQIKKNYNQIGKTNNARALLTLDVPLKRNTDMLNPVLSIYSEQSLEIMNYVHISEFNRYYYIERIEETGDRIYKLFCRVDVLESFKMDIRFRFSC